MPDNYFSDDEVSQEAVAEGGDTALLPRSFLSGSAKPGDTISLKVTRILDDQIEVTKGSYVEEEEETESLPMPEDQAQVPMGSGMGMFE